MCQMVGSRYLWTFDKYVVPTEINDTWIASTSIVRRTTMHY